MDSSDGSITYQCPEDSFIHCFCATSKHFIIAESPIDHPTKVTLHYISKSDTEKSTLIADDIGISINRNVAPRVRIVKNMLIAGSGAIQLIVNTSDGVVVYPFGGSQYSKDRMEPSKWLLSNSQDTIESVDIVEETDVSVDLVIGTKLGHVYCVRYESVKNRFSTLKRYKALDNVATDAVNSVRCAQGDIALASFDNFVYAWIDGKLESQHISNLPANSLTDHTVTSVDFVRIKKYSSSFLRFYAVNVTNLGCVLYRRSIRGQWEMMQVLPRDVDDETEEVTPLISCTIAESPNTNDLTIVSGGESGKLYEWHYRQTTNEVTLERTHSICRGIVHNIVATDPNTLNCLMNDDTCIGTLHI